MRYRINEAGNPMVVATAEELHALRPVICACFRRRANNGDVDDFAQDVEIIVWQALNEGRVPGHRLIFSVSWNVWRNHYRKRSTRCEVLHDELPDVAGPSPECRIDARETLRRIAMREDIARVLLGSVNASPAIRYEEVAKSTFA